MVGKTARRWGPWFQKTTNTDFPSGYKLTESLDWRKKSTRSTILLPPYVVYEFGVGQINKSDPERKDPAINNSLTVRIEVSKCPSSL